MKNEKWFGIGTRARNGGSFLECDVSPGPKQREACPSTVSSASDERMPQRSSTAVRMYENCTLSSDPYTELWTCVCVRAEIISIYYLWCLCVCVCVCCVCVCVCVRVCACESM